jgi:ribonuclease HI
LLNLNKSILLFGGASKGKPKEAGVGGGGGGVFFDPDGTNKLYFAWVLRHSSNNQVEALVVLKGLELIITEKYKDIVVIGDSKLVIKGLRNMTTCNHHNM